MSNTKVSSEQIIDDVALGGNPTTTTQSAGNNTTRVATTAFVTTAVSNLVDSAPSSLDTLNELAAAMNDNASFFSTVLPLSGGTMTGDLILGDSVQIELGSASGGDLRIYHDGSNSVILNNTGRLDLRAANLAFKNTTNNETYATFTENGAVELYHDNAKKIETFSGGIDVSGVIYNGGGTAQAVGIGASMGDVNAVELGAGYLSLARDDTADAKQILFEKNDVEHSSITTKASSLDIASAQAIILDSAGDITLDADGAEIFFKDGGTSFGRVFNSSGNFYINHPTQDKDIIFQGNDGGSDVTALTLDMSAAGFATFNDGITLKGESFLNTGSTTIMTMKDDGSSNFILRSFQQDKDVIFQGNDSGSVITALTLDMSDAGAALFNGNIALAGGADRRIQLSNSGTSAVNFSSNNTCSIRGDNDFIKINAAANGGIIMEVNGGECLKLDANHWLRLNGGNAQQYGDNQRTYSGDETITWSSSTSANTWTSSYYMAYQKFVEAGVHLGYSGNGAISQHFRISMMNHYSGLSIQTLHSASGGSGSSYHTISFTSGGAYNTRTLKIVNTPAGGQNTANLNGTIYYGLAI
jgi:hypothetical protein